MATKAAKTETVSTRQLAAQLAEKHELSQKSANAILEDTIGLITKHLKKGARIRLNGLGILVVRKRGPRMGRNPATGEAIKIKASKKFSDEEKITKTQLFTDANRELVETIILNNGVEDDKEV